jgi:hypothetical protein
MKKILIGCIVMLAACVHQENEGVFFRHFQNEYTRADDTISIKKGIVTRKTGYNKIRNGQLKPRQYEVERWRLNELGSAVIIIEGDELSMGNSSYKRIN